MAEKKLTLKQSLAALWQQAGDTFATKTDLSKLSGFVYGVSSTAVGTAAKAITAQNVASGWELEDGTILAVSFSQGTNTASNPTFNVNSSGAFRVKYKGSLIASSNLDFAGTTLVQFYYYDKTDRCWVWFFRDYGDEIVVDYYYNKADKKLYKNQQFTGDPILLDVDTVYLDKTSGLAYVAQGQDTVKLLGADNMVRGYYKEADGKFYLTRTGSSPNYTYSNEVDYNDNKLYLDNATGKIYVSSGTNLSMFFDTTDYYTKSQVDGLISGIHQFTYQVEPDRSILETTPTAANMYIIYLLPISGASSPNAKDEYIVIRSGTEGSYTYAWEMIGTTETDLSGYVSDVRYNSQKLQQKKSSGSYSDIVPASTIIDDGGAVKNVEYKSSGNKLVEKKGSNNAETDVLTQAQAQTLVGRGANGGVASLGSGGTVPLSELPNGVKNIIKGYYNYNTSTNKGEFFSNSEKTSPNEIGKDEEHIFMDTPTHLLYVWDGSEYVLLNGDYFAVTQTELNEILGIS